jgi:hypothetical protein
MSYYIISIDCTTYKSTKEKTTLLILYLSFNIPTSLFIYNWMQLSIDLLLRSICCLYILLNKLTKP